MKDILLRAMAYCRNHFVKASQKAEIEFNGHLIKGIHTGIAKAGQYILIWHSYLNDEIYRIAEVDTVQDGVLVEEDLQAESITADIYYLAIPQGFIKACNSIQNLEQKQSERGGISSERFGDYSVSFANDSIENVMKEKLKSYMRMFNDIGDDRC